MPTQTCSSLILIVFISVQRRLLSALTFFLGALEDFIEDENYSIFSVFWCNNRSLLIKMFFIAIFITRQECKIPLFLSIHKKPFTSKGGLLPIQESMVYFFY